MPKLVFSVMKEAGLSTKSCVSMGSDRSYKVFPPNFREEDLPSQRYIIYETIENTDDFINSVLHGLNFLYMSCQLACITPNSGPYTTSSHGLPPQAWFTYLGGAI